VALAGCGGSDREPPRERDDAPTAPADLAILRFALTLEYFTADFYERLLAERTLEGSDRDVVKGLRDDEEKHIDALEGLVDELGGTPPGRPLPDFDKLLSGQPEAVLGRVSELEDLGAAAYLGQVPLVQDKDVLAALLSIHSVEGRHAAALGHRLGRSFVPDGALARPLDARTVRARMAGFEL